MTLSTNCYKYGTVTNKDLAQRVETELLAEKAKIRAQKIEQPREGNEPCEFLIQKIIDIFSSED